MAQYIQDALSIIGALGTIATILSHAPFVPARAQALLARFGLTSQKFAVYAKPAAEKPL